MSRTLLSGFSLLFLAVLFFSCQKELSFEQGQPSHGSLQGAGGECLPKLINGTYTAGQALTDSNYLEVTVNVTQTGTYTITTDTLNGYYFRATGNFSTTGDNTVRLRGFGTPVNAGINDFMVVYDSTFCTVPVIVDQGGGGSAAFTLEGAGGACTISNVAGTYTQAVALTSSNLVVLSVNVTTIGSWSVSTNSVAGMTFSGTGTFTTTGVQNITLTGSGTPTTAGTQTLSVSAGGGSCTFEVSVAPNSAPPAVFTLEGSPGACGGFVIVGSYVQGTPLNSSNTITVQVNVTTAGTYSITTNTVAGISFSASGVFTTTGVQNVTLTGSGTPTATGDQTLTLTAGSSNCTVVVNCTGGIPATGDHFPLTANSWWSYNDPSVATDTIKRTNVAAVTLAGNSYRVFEETDHIGDPSFELYFRKAGNDYFEYGEVHNYALVTFDNTVLGDILFLKEGLTAPTSWTTSEFTGTENSVPVKLRYVFNVTDINGTATINGKNFSNVYKLNFKSQVSVNGAAFQDEGLVWDAWYAQGVGLIYMKGTLGTNSIEWRIRNWVVN